MDKFIRVPINDNERFLIESKTYIGESVQIHITMEYKCSCQTDENEDMTYIRDDGICYFCNNEHWTTYQDEGTGFPKENIDDIILALNLMK